MPLIYLSPSTQEYNTYITGGTEEQFMNLIAESMVPHLNSSGIKYVRNTPDMSSALSVRESNLGNYDLHLAIHSNYSPEYLAGEVRGIDVFYHPRNLSSAEAAETISENLKTIYPNPDLVKALPSTTIGEVRRPKAPSVLVEVGYHDNYEDAAWIIDNIDAIALNLVQSLAQYFKIPFIPAQKLRKGIVRTNGSNLNIRSSPSFDATVLATVLDGSTIDILGQYGDWYTVRYGDTVGYAFTQYVEPE